jgi:hypothetical protein
MAIEGLPWRGPGPGRPDLPLPPGRVPVRRGGAWRKRWRYLGAFSDELMLCAARVQVGPLGQTFWAIWVRGERELHERTRPLPPMIARGEVWTESVEGDETGRIDWAPEGSGTLVRIEAEARGEQPQVRGFLRAGEGRWVEAVCATGERAGYVWTRKRIVSVECDVRIGERRLRAEARGIEDESCGYHPSPTVWDWCAGGGRAAAGRAVGWNLVSGVNDPPSGSERAIWIEGEPSEPPPVAFEDLRAVTLEGGRLAFEAEAERPRTESKPFVHYSYRQPFGNFSGTLPGGIELAEGMGVMEHHEARW